MKTISVIIVDDHHLIRQMWAKMFDNNEHMNVIGQCGTLDEAVEMIKTKRPDLVLLDINLGEESGFDAVPLIRKFSPGTKIIAVSMHAHTSYAKKMLRLGVKAYITKNSPYDEMVKAINEVMNDRVYICEEIKMKSAESITDEATTSDSKNLSLREIEIIKLIKAGSSSKDIAAGLFISLRTVETHRYNILRKLNLKNTLEMMNYIHNSDLNFI